LPGDNHLTLVLDRVRIQGPLDRSVLRYPDAYHLLLPEGDPPEDPDAREQYARRILRSLAERAFRRPVDEETLDRLFAVAFRNAEMTGLTFTERIGDGLTAMLCSPRFLFRVEPQPASPDPEKSVWVDEFALASRLSYFLWSSLPDEELFDLARTNQLRANLDSQIQRMLADPRSDRFIENFVGQWLQTRDVEGIAIDERRVLSARSSQESKKVFHSGVRKAMRRETEMFFADLLRRDGRLEELLTARHTFLNETLARFYDVPGVTGSEMRRVDLPEDSPRGGLLTHGSFLLVTSNPTRTSPVKRGQFILDNLLGMPAAPPPADVPELEEAGNQQKEALTMRQLMALHRENALCASCHERMDPPGLALEHFDALGLYREEEQGQPIETDGVLATGEAFADHAELAVALATSRRHDLYRCATEKLLIYAVGRGLEYYDIPTIDGIMDDLKRSDGSLQTLVYAVIKSPPFQMQRGSGTQTADTTEPGPETPTKESSS
jgi:hypothetical protein